MKTEVNTIVEEIKYYCKSHDLKEHDRLPSERKLGEILSSTRANIRKALNILIDENYIYIRNMSGYFLMPKKTIIEIEDYFDFFFSDELESIIIEQAVANKVISKRMKLLLGTKLTHIKKIHHKNGDASAIFDCYINDEEVKNLNLSHSDIKNQLTISLASMDIEGKISFRRAYKEEPDLLDITEDDTILRIKINYILGDKVIIIIDSTLKKEYYEIRGC